MYRTQKFSRFPISKGALSFSHALSTLIAFAVLVQCAGGADWTTWDVLRPTTKAADGKFAPDGRLMILFTEETASQSSAPLAIKLATFNNPGFSVIEIGRIGPSSNAEQQSIRLIGDDRSLWAVWRDQPAVGPTSLRASQVFPRPAAFEIETIDTGTSNPHFDAAMNADGFPRVAFIEAGKKKVTIARRIATGSWDVTDVLRILPSNELQYEDLAIATLGNRLALIVSTLEVLPVGSLKDFRSQLLTYYATEPATWSNITFESFWEMENFSSNFNVPYARFPKALWTESNVLMVSYATFFGSGGVVSTHAVGTETGERNHFVSREFGNVTNPSLAVDPEGRIHFNCTDPGPPAVLDYRIRDGGSILPTDPVLGLAAASVDLELDDKGNPWIISRHPDQTRLQVSTLTDITDLDSDGVLYLIEKAILMNPEVADSENLPIYAYDEVNGLTYPTFSFRSQNGGSGSNPYLSPDFEYRTEVSSDLENWSSSPGDVILSDRFSISGRFTVNIYRSTTPLGSREFIRLVIKRR